MWRHQKSRSVCVKQALVDALVTWHVSYKITTLPILLSTDPNYFEERTWNLIILFFFTLHLVWIHYLKVRVRKIRGKPSIKTLLPHMFSISVLVLGCWLMNHVIYLILKQKNLLLTLKDAGFWEVFFQRNEVCLIKFSFKWRCKYFISKLRCSANFWHLDQCF